MRFADRQAAGRELAQLLACYRDEQPVVVALPRGGVVVGAEVARAFGAPLDVLVARKLGAPSQPELAVGAIAEGGAVYIDQRVRNLLGVFDEEIEEISAREEAELQRRVRRYRGGRPPLDVTGRTVILVDDGIATGSTVLAAIRALRPRGPRRIVLGAPVAAAETLERLRLEVDDVVAVEAPDDLFAIGAWYQDFDQVGDEEVVALLDEAHAPEQVAPTGVVEEEVRLSVGGTILEGDLVLPAGATALVLFAHGSGSGRRSPRNRFVAARLQRAGLGTLLFDLLTDQEVAEDERTGDLRFDIPLLAERLIGAIDWVRATEATRRLDVGLFGSSTGAAAALVAAAARPGDVRAVVSRGGRPDLAIAVLGQVRAPTLLIVGGAEDRVPALNRSALGMLQVEKRLVEVPGATHRFEEPGALESVADHARAWFAHFLVAGPERGLLFDESAPPEG